MPLSRSQHPLGARAQLTSDYFSSDSHGDEASSTKLIQCSV